MVIYGSILFALIAVLVLYFRFREQAAWWEYLLPFAACLIPATIIKFTVAWAITADTEWWTGRVERVEYYEDWNEKVTYTTTETYTKADGSLGTRTVTRTRIDYHPEYWTLRDSNDIEVYIDKKDYKSIVSRWDNEEFRNMRRDYHTNDGDMYYANFPGGERSTFIFTTTHSYTNKVAASENVFDFEEINPDEWDIFDYPDNGWAIDDDHFLSQVPIDAQEARRLAMFNARWGKPKQIRVWFLVFQDDTLDTAYAQESHWKGGNKNELVVCIGVNGQRQVQWGHVFSWTEREDFKVELRNLIAGMKGEQLSFSPALDWLDDNIGRWQRKEFADFSYLKVPTPMWAIMLNYFVTMAASAGVVWFAATNQYTEDNPKGEYRSRFHRRWR